MLCLVSQIANCEEWFTDGKPDGPKSFQGGSGDFGAMIFMTTNSQKMLANWEAPTAGFHILESENVVKGKPIEALVVFSGCAANEEGNCIAEIDYQILKPDGTIYAEYKNTELWKNKPALPKGQMGLSVDRVGLIAEDSDPTGIYKVTCVVKDLVSNSKFFIYSSFQVNEANKPIKRD
jgi:hypothetical protein